MPIVRTYQCGECFHRMEVTLSAEQWDDPPPECPACAAREMNQEFKPVAIGGSTLSRAAKLAETIAVEDYGVADMTVTAREGDRPKVRYKDTRTHMPSTWEGGQELLQTALARGRETRMRHGDGLDILQGALKSGAQPDLIEQSKRRAMRVW